MDLHEVNVALAAGDIDSAGVLPKLEELRERPLVLNTVAAGYMDRALIAPGDDLLWRVSRILDDRIEGQRELLDLRNRSVLVPTNQRYHPRQDALRWRQERLRQ